MTHQDLLAAIATLLDDLAARPEDRAELVAQLRRKIGALRAAGLPVRAELLQYEDAPAEAGAEDIFDNMPV
ncbi:MAG: hypothetical protein KDK11_03325 [Maritimibacter sp.]|nr:hypothetical protein [Maritimibacter sp.]